MEEKIISCIGSYAQPIVNLNEIMHSFKYSGQSKIKVSPRENSYAASIIGLSILMLESIINRIKYLENKNEEKNLDFFKNFFDGQMYNELAEIYIMRDCIIHNHLWEFTIKYNENFEEEILDKKMVKGYGDKKYHQYTDEESITSKNLKLNLNPINIGRDDVVKIFTFLKKFLNFIESKNKNYSYILNEHVKINNCVNDDITLVEFETFLEKQTRG